MFRQLWKKNSFRMRSREGVFKAVGIDPNAEYSEEQLEEFIVLKAVRDYNHSKFGQTDHVIIEGIIKDVFQDAIPDLDRPVQDYGNLEKCLQ